MATTFDQILAAIEATIPTTTAATELASMGLPHDPIEYDGSTKLKAGFPIIVRVAVRPEESVRETLGGTPPTGQTQYGRLIVQIFQALGNGSGLAVRLADNFRTSYNEVDISTSEGTLIQFMSPSVRIIGDEGHGYFQVNVDCPWIHYER